MSITSRLLPLAVALPCGVTAAVYANFSLRVMPALGRLPDATGIARMQQFNRTAVQAPFMTCFFGAAIGSVWLALRALRSDHTRAGLLAGAGGGLYLVGFLLTIVYNVPLNERLARATGADVDVWRRYLTVWTRANSVRAVLSGVACLLLLAAIGCRRP